MGKKKLKKDKGKTEESKRLNKRNPERKNSEATGNEAEELQVKVGKDVKLPPRSEVIVKGYYEPDDKFNGQTLLMEPVEITVHAIMAARCIAKPTNDCRIPGCEFHFTVDERGVQYLEGEEAANDCVPSGGTPHSTTGESPHFLMHGRDIELPFDDIIEPLIVRVNYANDSNYAAELRARLNIAFGEVRDRLQHAHQQQAKYYNRGSREASFRPGDRVFLHVPFVGIGRKKKLSRQWQGPYRDLEQTSPVNFRVQHIFRPKDCQLVHANRLKIARGIQTKPLLSPPAKEAITYPPPPKTSTSPRAEMRQPSQFVLELDLLPPLPSEPPPSSSPPAPPQPPPPHTYQLRSRGPITL
ncbi:hypothetical protein J437_LFUL000788 [Ladona fulva]|uniref:Integrase p58-like C-terminal domain-containing protein n=1 Tax=Ladona fulva TaxID=123851 RepID=A0A8K0KYH7_LADFU|nr:hypothetical protein J437_LFUL000788 [Ladona fulva]